MIITIFLIAILCVFGGQVLSPAAMVSAVTVQNHALNYLRVEGLDQVFSGGTAGGGLRWNNQYSGSSVFVSDGPMINTWSSPPVIDQYKTNERRVMTLGTERFVTGVSMQVPSDFRPCSFRNMQYVCIANWLRFAIRFHCLGLLLNALPGYLCVPVSAQPIPVSVNSTVPLKHVSIYSAGHLGHNLLFRLSPAPGADPHHIGRTLLLNGVIQKQLVIVAEDTVGHRAVAFPYHHRLNRVSCATRARCA